MCYFVLIAIPESARAKLSTPRRLWPFDEADAAVMLRVCRRWGGAVWGAADLCVYSASAGCGCGLFSEPRAAPTPEEIAHRSERMIEKYRRKGWSAEKIRRAVEGSEEKRRRDEGEKGGLAQQAAEFVAWIAEEVGEAAVMGVWLRPGERREVSAGPVMTSSQIRSGEREVGIDEVVRVVAERSLVANELRMRSAV